MASNLHPLMAAICEDFLAAHLRDAQAGRLSHDPSQTCSEKDALVAAAQAVVDRWDTPLWKDVPATAVYINALRAALAAQPRTARQTHGATARVDAWDQAVTELAKARETGADATTLRRLESAEEMARDAVYEARDIEPKALFGEDE